MAVTVSSMHVRTPLYARPTLWMPVAAMVMFLSLYLPLATALVHSPTQSPLPPLVKTAQERATLSLGVAEKSASKPICSSSSFGQPTGIDLQSAPVGLSVQEDTPLTYRIYGDTADDLRSQIEHCAPGASASNLAEFTADTSYNMTWQYNTVVTGTDTCTLGGIKVGMHTSTIMPLWLPNSTATGGLTSRWQSFMSALMAHEQGHAALDKQYAATALADLNALPAMNCNNLTQTVKSTLSNDMSALNNANTNYDATTDHGATQGAILPTH